MKNVVVLLSIFSFLFLGQNGWAQKTASLSENEKDGIQFMLEEEKLARDVYLALNEKWETTVFSHISNSEQKHVDKMKKLATQFGLEIPATVAKDQHGKFQNKDLQNLYDKLVKTGNTSLEEAFRVGAKIEELDIRDLNEAMAVTKWIFAGLPFSSRKIPMVRFTFPFPSSVEESLTTSRESASKADFFAKIGSPAVAPTCLIASYTFLG